jgi:polyhydroxybutyrate depolymerase
LLVVAPDGSKKGWNDSFAHVRNKPETDDTGMIRNLIAHMIREHEADPQRVYVIGVSKGGMMAYRLATELGSMLAAFASVLANMPQQSVCAAPVTPISALIVASTRDPLVPYGGGKYFYTPLLSPMKSINDTVDIWRTLANLPATGKSVDIPKSAASNPTSCTRITWGDNPEQLQIVLLRINGGGHAEPSQSQFYPWFLSRLVGAQNTDIDIAEEAWAFFKDKRCKDAGGNSLPETASGENK